jgi:hypothetical protein
MPFTYSLSFLCRPNAFSFDAVTAILSRHLVDPLIRKLKPT